jgi:hypothetical protein
MMLVAFGIGLWAILSFGSILLKAPEDLAGRWELYDQEEVGVGASSDARTQVLLIEQSGQYFKLTLEGRQMGMKLLDQRISTTGANQQTVITLDGAAGQAVFTGPEGGDLFVLELTGAKSGKWIARCVERLYPKPTRRARSVAPPTTLPATHPTTANARL